MKKRKFKWLIDNNASRLIGLNDNVRVYITQYANYIMKNNEICLNYSWVVAYFEDNWVSGEPYVLTDNLHSLEEALEYVDKRFLSEEEKEIKDIIE